MAKRRRRNRSRNRRKGSEGFAFPRPLASVLTVAAVLSLTYLWLHGQGEALGFRIQDMEGRLNELQQRVANEESKWSNMKSLPSVRRALRRNGAVMNWPSDHRVVWMDEPVPLDTATRLAFALNPSR